jgi:hypothetical protein
MPFLSSSRLVYVHASEYRGPELEPPRRLGKNLACDIREGYILEIAAPEPTVWST